jgi:hypothetical protein
MKKSLEIICTVWNGKCIFAVLLLESVKGNGANGQELRRVMG